MRFINLAILAAATSLASAAFAAPAADKSNYTLFNPTPVDRMRDLSTDRPDKTESPATVDAGHVQIESDLITYAWDHDKSGGGNVHTSGFNMPTLNLKFGLTNSSDIQFVYDGYSHSRSSDKVAGTRDTTDGLGDLTVRYKYNFWGNDGGDTAFSLMPFVKFPTNTNDVGNDSVEAGLIVPYSMQLNDTFALATMLEADLTRDDTDDGYHGTYVASASLGFDHTDKLGQYVELYAEQSDESKARTIVTFDTGLTYALTDNLQLDGGVNLGITSAADDVNPFLGISYRY